VLNLLADQLVKRLNDLPWPVLSGEIIGVMIEIVIRDLVDQVVKIKILENQIEEMASQYLIGEIEILSGQIVVRKDMSGAVLPKM
jgi:hypothetical protein